MKQIIIFILIFAPNIFFAQKNESILNVDFIGLKTGYSYCFKDDLYRTPTFTPYIMNIEYIFDQRFPGVGVQGLSMYYVDKGSSLGMTGLFYLSYNLLNVFSLKNETAAKRLQNGKTKYLTTKNKQLNVKNRW